VAAARSTLIIGTEDEVCAAAGGDDDVAAASARLLTPGGPALIVKRGSHGATVLRPGQPACDVPPFQVDVLNVLGAGDAFASGLLTAWLDGWTLERAARFGNATGAIVVTRHSCANDMPTRPEVDRFVASQGGWGFADDAGPTRAAEEPRGA
jgi:5-dehydro-2-deoxygluconokinase